ncbi:uncharacterized protein F5147DRAFT_649225 [Suillus discolor]|uniref:Uncharacterized protein n=1 Tax=Suillus discolor TaxID=1912936 RepID=A0A9P7FE56_9AGAM|nr:uncharacterized protein F5147DRAFT_649225 [Suillus discolor]KAG2115761.1 hypothetical protein F5147DRAFT_649225 [Suillus discolor]
MWGETETFQVPNNSRCIIIIITVMWASIELDQMLGNREVIRKLEISRYELLGHGDEPSRQCKSIINCEIARNADAGHARLAKYVTRKIKRVSYLNDAVKRFQLFWTSA